MINRVETGQSIFLIIQRISTHIRWILPTYYTGNVTIDTFWDIFWKDCRHLLCLHKGQTLPGKLIDNSFSSEQEQTDYNQAAEGF